MSSNIVTFKPKDEDSFYPVFVANKHRTSYFYYSSNFIYSYGIAYYVQSKLQNTEAVKKINRLNPVITSSVQRVLRRIKANIDGKNITKETKTAIVKELHELKKNCIESLEERLYEPEDKVFFRTDEPSPTRTLLSKYFKFSHSGNSVQFRTTRGQVFFIHGASVFLQDEYGWKMVFSIAVKKEYLNHAIVYTVNNMLIPHEYLYCVFDKDFFINPSVEKKHILKEISVNFSECDILLIDAAKYTNERFFSTFIKQRSSLTKQKRLLLEIEADFADYLIKQHGVNPSNIDPTTIEEVNRVIQEAKEKVLAKQKEEPVAKVVSEEFVALSEEELQTIREIERMQELDQVEAVPQPGPEPTEDLRVEDLTVATAQSIFDGDGSERMTPNIYYYGSDGRPLTSQESGTLSQVFGVDAPIPSVSTDSNLTREQLEQVIRDTVYPEPSPIMMGEETLQEFHNAIQEHLSNERTNNNSGDTEVSDQGPQLQEETT